MTLLCLGELGYVKLDARGSELLFEILTEREGKASAAVASNLPFSKAHRFRRTCARQHLKLTCSGDLVRQTSVVDVICKVVNETFGFHAEGLAGDFGIERYHKVDDSRGAQQLWRHAGRVENVA